ncbi:hypothetical protein BBOV_III005435 [Babesia bovis T2Bo]|uniref:hypothetical protein n=1 Tax=Babesia bovis T2Bo TaxID=484906 RepID=UPI001C353B97|nr:hypothetical protein BBOV_III005435 [Babesia bovis T2Bo]KAG6440057.1 hypothetical protein BBOV_III005435 [Babesia bovis T2Bo]
MKIITKGEPVAAEDALVCIRRYLESHRNRTPKGSISDPEVSKDMEYSTDSDITMSPEEQEWHRRIAKLQAFSQSQPNTSPKEEERIKFLEAVESYIVRSTQI